MNVLLVTSAAPAMSPFNTDEKRPALGIGSLLAVARAQGHTVHFIDNYLAPTDFIDANALNSRGVECIGIYANTICYRDTLRMIRDIDALRQAGKWSGLLSVGGPHTSVALDSIPSCVDHLVLGEGERAFLDILAGRATSRVISGEPLKNLDDLPFQPWDIFTQLNYDSRCDWMDAEPVFTLNTSRGCPYKCTFCSVGSVWGKRYVAQSAERVVAEMEDLVREHGARGFYFREDHFTHDAGRTHRFCELLLDRRMRTRWACETRVDRLSLEMVRLMASAGCEAVYLGVESGSQRMLDALRKNITVDQIERAVTWCKQSGINTYCSMIVGVPGETYADYLASERLMRKLSPTAYAFNVFVGIPTSPLYRWCIETGAYEHRDDLGLIYLPGFDIKAKYFYGLDSTSMVDHKFTRRTAFDEALRRRLLRRGLAARLRGSASSLRRRYSRLSRPSG